MKAPASDRFYFNREKYSVIDMTGGLTISTDPYCGQRCYKTYTCSAKRLYLTTRISRVKYFGYLPDAIKRLTADEYLVTEKLREVVHFTGKIRLARDFIEELNVPTGYQKPTAFRTVLDITLKDGHIVEIKDRSEEMEQGRVALKQRYESGGAEQSTDETFSFSMDSE